MLRSPLGFSTSLLVDAAPPWISHPLTSLFDREVWHLLPVRETEGVPSCSLLEVLRQPASRLAS